MKIATFFGLVLDKVETDRTDHYLATYHSESIEPEHELYYNIALLDIFVMCYH